MKSLSSVLAGNIVPTANYSGGTYSLSGLVVGTNYSYSMGTNDTSIVFSGGATFAKSASATGVFTATATSATLNGSGTSAIGTVIAPVLGVSLYPATVTPTQPARQVTVGQFPANNPNFSRQIQISDQYVFVKNGTYSVAISLPDLINICLTEEINLTWTPPVALAQPSNASCVHSSTAASFTFTAGSEFTMSYQWQYYNGSSWTNITSGSAINGTVYSGYTATTLTATPTTTGQTGISHRCIVTDNAGNFGLTNGSVTSSSATLTIT